jgi:hypothetical protein
MKRRRYRQAIGRSRCLRDLTVADHPDELDRIERDPIGTADDRVDQGRAELGSEPHTQLVHLFRW